MNETLYATVAGVLGLSPADVNDETSAENTPEWDSLKHVNIVMAVEQAFGLKFDMNEIMEINSVGRIAEALQKKL
jgi:acyl carrier protein